MSYTRNGSPPVPLSGSPSHQPNNLSSSEQIDMIAYIRFSEVIMTSLSGSSKKIPISSRCHIYQASFVTIHDVSFLVLASSLGVQVWTIDGLEMKFFFALSALVDSEEDGHFMRGIAHINKGYVCVGCSTGNVLVLNAPSADGENIEMLHNLDASRSPITAIAASETLLVCANEAGEVIGFSVAEAFEVMCKFPGAHFPCTSVCTREDTIIAAYSTGHIRLFRASISELAIEVAAHSRCITALAIDPSLNVLASVSEDQYLHVWHFPTFVSRENCDMDLLFTEKIDNRLLTGVAFLNNGKIGVTAYDEDDMIIFSKT
eukprot:gene6345-12830_t